MVIRKAVSAAKLKKRERDFSRTGFAAAAAGCDVGAEVGCDVGALVVVGVGVAAAGLRAPA